MAKGKKFDAAEKHFAEKISKLRRENNHLQETLNSLRRENQQYAATIQSLESENAQLKNWVERLLEYTELSKEDIKQACEKDKEMVQMAIFLNRFYH